MRIQFSALAAAALALLLSTACQREERTGENTPGELVDVSLSAVIPGQDMAVVRSSGDGSNINRCILEIYLTEDVTNGTYAVYDKITVGVVNGQADFDLKLVRGQKYNLALWADCAVKNGDGTLSDKYYITNNSIGLRDIRLNSNEKYFGNDEERDAFYAYETNLSIEEISSITLKRPFAQLNIFSTDIEDIKAEKLKPAKVKINFNKVFTCFSVISGNGMIPGSISYEEPQPIDWSVEDGKQQMSMDYLFACAVPANNNMKYIPGAFTMTFYNSSDEEITSYNFPTTTIPITPNYKTNVSGALLTESGNLSVSLETDFTSELVYSEEQMISVLKEGGDVRLGSNITVSEGMIIPNDGASVNIDLGGNTLTFSSSSASVFAENGSTVTISGGTVKAPSLPLTDDKGDKVTRDLFSVGSGGTLILEDVTIETSNSCIGVDHGIDGGKIVIRGSEIKSPKMGLTTNANTENGSVSQNVELELENTSFACGTPLLINIPCELTMNGCDVDGEFYGLIMRGGVANITNSTITLNYTDTDGAIAGNYFDKDNWGTGNMVNVAALTAGNKGDGYQYPTEVNLKGTTVEIMGPYEDNLPAMYVWANPGDGLGVTITYDDATKFNGACIYGNSGANITVNGQPAPQE